MLWKDAQEGIERNLFNKFVSKIEKNALSNII